MLRMLITEPSKQFGVCICVQVAKSTAVADEALGNVRTVRAFAMEETETRSCDLQFNF